MKTQMQEGITPKLVDQPVPIRKKNAWWRRLKIGRALRRYPYVVSEGSVWFGRKTPNQRAFVWIEADAFISQVAANDAVYGNAK